MKKPNHFRNIAFVLLMLSISSCIIIKLKSSKIEEQIPLSSTLNNDIGTQLLLNSSNLSINGGSIDTLKKKVKIKLKNATTGDIISVVFPKGSYFNFNASFIPKIVGDSIYPEFQTLEFNSSKPIAFKHNKKGLLKLKSIQKNSKEQIELDFTGVSLINIILAAADVYLISKNQDFKYSSRISKLPDFVIENFNFNVDSLNLVQNGYTIKSPNEFKISLENFEITENLNKINLGEIELNLRNSILHTRDFDFELKDGSFDMSNYQVELIDKGYKVIKEQGGSSVIHLKGGTLNGLGEAITEGSFENLKFDLSSYDYSSIGGNSKVKGKIDITGRFRQLKNNYDFRESEYYYVLEPFELQNLSIAYSDDGNDSIVRTFTTEKPIELKFRDFYFQEFGKYEFFSRGMGLTLPKTEFKRIDSISVAIEDEFKFGTEYTSVNLYSQRPQQFEFPQGLSFDLSGLEKIKIFKNEKPSFDTINLKGKIKSAVVRSLKDTTVTLSLEDALINMEIFENGNTIDYEGEVYGDTLTTSKEVKIISKYLKGGSVSFSKIGLSGANEEVKIENLKIMLPKVLVNSLLEAQLRKFAVKDHGRVGEIDLKVGTIGIYARVNNIHLKSFNFSGTNTFNFNVGGSVTLYRPKKKILFGEGIPRIQDTKRIRNAHGYGTISINPNDNLSQTTINISTNYKDGEIDIENFPGVLEKGIGGTRKALGSALKNSLVINPFESATPEELGWLNKIKLTSSPKISENDSFYIFETSAQINN
ncbi:hypothetical protein J8L85_11190 [Maribacter sp. MMG018]|uniref:hypothetical protein n=1 Tax=Maribacter sp. MMG018 TaxID=2822688 RepID=UPI001B39124B|nr:hypothetical protein [Maribacter sp. MMG018]MBQ4915005.1 hypothetical protein [Maribacter sp. MMG018]